MKNVQVRAVSWNWRCVTKKNNNNQSDDAGSSEGHEVGVSIDVAVGPGVGLVLVAAVNQAEALILLNKENH